MNSRARKRSEGNIYHITARGIGRQVIFEDDSDRARMRDAIASLMPDYSIEVYAWCFMENHIHLLMHALLEDVSAFMRTLQAGYARYFNKRHDRVGTLFQGRFSAKPINTDEQLMSTVSYIHRNPLEMGFGLDYTWSSYREYVGNPSIASTSFVLDVFDGVDNFVSFHESGAMLLSVCEVSRIRLSESQAKQVLHEVLGDLNPYDVRTLSKEERDGILRRLKKAGLSVRQVERATSIGRNIVSKA